jgi:anthranilate synthase component II
MRPALGRNRFRACKFSNFTTQTDNAVRVLLLDNFDSFTYNIVHYLEGMEAHVHVVDNKRISAEDLEGCDCLVISPGPGLPAESGKLMEMLALAARVKKPVLGICLGMQAIAEHFGGSIYNQQEVRHGKQEKIAVRTDSALFKGVPRELKVGLYHSWAVSQDLPAELVATSFSESGVMMSLEHRSMKIWGVQFHPESIMSEHGKELLANFLRSV